MTMQADTVQKSTPARKERKRKKKLVRRIVALLLVCLLIAAAVWLGYSRLRQEYTVTYQPYSATIGSISNSLSFSGTLQAISNQTYTASSATAVRAVYVEKGADVKEGDQLMRLNNGTVIEAEFDGRVNQLPVAAGDKVSSGDTLIQVVDFTHMKVSIRVDEYDISDVQVGDAVKVTTTATEKTFETVIEDIDYVSSSTGSVAYYTAIAYVDVDGGVYPGMQVTVTIPQEEASNVVILREEALSFDGTNQAFVYTQNADGEMEQTYVKTGVSNGKYVEIAQGLRDGDTVYAVVEAEESSGIASLFSSIFGSQRVMGSPQRQTRQQNNGTTDRAPGNFSAPGNNGWNGSGRP